MEPQMKTFISALRTAYFYVFMVIDVLILVAVYPLLKRKQKKLPNHEYETLINKRVAKWSRRQMKNTGSNITIIGHENIPEGGVLFISNHQSYFDIGIFLTYIEKNKGYIAKIGVSTIPFIKDYLNDLRCLFLDRGNMRQNMKVIIDGIEVLKSGYSLVIFPEGTRSNEIGEFKAGSFKLATKSGVPIVPVTIDGAYKILEKGKKLIYPADVIVTIHPPIYTKDMPKEEANNLHVTVHNIIAGSLTM
jgi:1-acyl-sn-glycerol-3-phosphate acyltransferase